MKDIINVHTQWKQEQQSIHLFIQDEISIFFTIIQQTLQQLLSMLSNYQQTSTNYQLVLQTISKLFQQCVIESIPIYRQSQSIESSDKLIWKIPSSSSSSGQLQELIVVKPYLYQNQINTLLDPYNGSNASVLIQYYDGLLSHYQTIQSQQFTN